MSEQRLGRVSHRGIAEEAASLIRRAIFEGRFEPGEMLREVELAASLGVSRGSVREGLGQLEREGIVVTGWHRPSRVIDISAPDAVELYELRVALDRLAASGAARFGQTDKIASALRDLERAVDAHASIEELLELDLRFHDAIYVAAHNGRLLHAWQTIRSQIQFFQTRRVLSDVDDYRKRIVSEHGELLRLIADGASTELDDYAARHVSSALGVLLAGLSDGKE
ncbi:GntR family transcriptional regulator [Microbacterium sp. RD1]|uniref:GntR family transcriptional regulator n=1 Tax=Microbacterium sp. RD1 TaxID=3457313 RepID=UPI003FA5CEBE